MPSRRPLNTWWCRCRDGPRLTWRKADRLGRPTCMSTRGSSGVADGGPVVLATRRWHDTDRSRRRRQLRSGRWLPRTQRREVSAICSRAVPHHAGTMPKVASEERREFSKLSRWLLPSHVGSSWARSWPLPRRSLSLDNSALGQHPHCGAPSCRDGGRTPLLSEVTPAFDPVVPGTLCHPRPAWPEDASCWRGRPSTSATRELCTGL